MKILVVLLFVVAGAALGFVAWKAPARDYVAPTAQEIEAHRPAPQELAGDVPADCVVRTFEVAGMCCTGCTGKLYAKIKDVPGVEQAAVNFEKGTAEIVVKKGADVAPLAEALCFGKYSAKLRP